jgi:DHA2 family multidrug resistance protein-like MFS transporter
MLSVCVLVGAIDVTIVGVALTPIARGLSASNGQLQWVNAAYTLTAASFMLVAGSFADWWGRRRTLVAGVLLFGAASVAAAWAPSAGVLIAARAVMGVGAAVVLPVSLAMIPTIFPPAETRKAIGIWGAMASFALPLGPLIGGLLLAHYWWGSIFLINVFVVIVAVPLTLILLPESRNEHAARIDLISILLAVGGVAALTYGLTSAESGWNRPVPLAWMVIGAAGIVAFFFRQKYAERPLLKLEYLAMPRFCWSTISVMMLLFSQTGIFFVVPQFMQAVLGRSPLYAGVQMVWFAVLAGVGALLSARAAKVIGGHWVIAVGLVSTSVGLLVLSRATPHSGPVLFAVGLAVVGFAAGFAPPSAAAEAMSALPREVVGSASGFINSSRHLGGALGVAFVGSLVATLYVRGLPGAVDQLGATDADSVRSSIDNVDGVAARVGAAGDPVRAGAFDAFTHAMNVTFVLVAAVALVCAVTVVWALGRSRRSAAPSER